MASITMDGDQCTSKHQAKRDTKYHKVKNTLVDYSSNGIGCCRPYALAYSVSTMLITALHTLFVFNYTRVYFNIFGLPDMYYVASHVVLFFTAQFTMVWVRRLQKSGYFTSAPATSLLAGGLMYSVMFVTFWFPWDNGSESSPLSLIHFGLGLCFYDMAYVIVTTAQSELFESVADLQVERTNLAFNSQTARLIGSCSVLFIELFSNSLQVFWAYQAVCVVLGLCTFAAIRYTFTVFSACKMDSFIKSLPADKQKVYEHKSEVFLSCMMDYPGVTVCSVLCSRSFICFLIVTFIQVFHTSYLCSFVSLFYDQLVPFDFTTCPTRSLIYGACVILPQFLLVLFFTRRLHWSTFFWIAFIVKFGMGCGLFFHGPTPGRFNIVFIVDSLLAVTTTALIPNALSALMEPYITEKKAYRALQPTIFYIHASVMRAAAVLAPIVLGVALASLNYQKSHSGKVTPSIEMTNIHMAMFDIAWMFAVIGGLTQIIVWLFYNGNTTTNIIVAHCGVR